MPVYLMPAPVSVRLQEQMTEAKRLLNIQVLDAKVFQFDIIYTQDELAAFGTPQGATIVLIAEDGPAFERLIPERRDGQLNYLHLKNETAIQKIQTRLAALSKPKE